jgi:hypothetical protein
MNIDNPIVVLATPRSGSSLVAGCLHALGVWVGRCRKADEHNKRGYFENKALSKLRCSNNFTRESVLSVLSREGYKGGPWLAKHTPRYLPCWADFENPVIVTVERRPTAVYASRKKRGDDMDQAIFEIGRDMHLMQSVKGALRVSSDDIIAGDYSGLQAVCRAARINWDADCVRAFVDESLWHH